MGNQKMGYEGQIFYGVAGSTGSTQLTNATDISFDFTPQNGDTTVRGVGTAPPITTGSVTAIGVQIEWTMIYDITDSALTALIGASAAGTAVAIRLKDYSAGKGPDCDCIITVKNGLPLNGNQTKQFTATPTRDAGRAPQLYV